MKPPLQRLHVQKKRKRTKRLFWSRRNSCRRTIVRQVFHLPTRRTLTYAEAQRFVDVYVNGSHRQLNVSEPLCIVDECDVRNDSEWCDVDLPSETNKSQQSVNYSQHVHVLPLSAGATVSAKYTNYYYRHVDQTAEEQNEEVEYDTDEQVSCFLYVL